MPDTCRAIVIKGAWKLKRGRLFARLCLALHFWQQLRAPKLPMTPPIKESVAANWLEYAHAMLAPNGFQLCSTICEALPRLTRWFHIGLVNGSSGSDHGCPICDINTTDLRPLFSSLFLPPSFSPAFPSSLRSHCVPAFSLYKLARISSYD